VIFSTALASVTEAAPVLRPARHLATVFVSYVGEGLLPKKFHLGINSRLPSHNKFLIFHMKRVLSNEEREIVFCGKDAQVRRPAPGCQDSDPLSQGHCLMSPSAKHRKWRDSANP
jgi:hypothetical protein